MVRRCIAGNQFELVIAFIAQTSPTRTETALALGKAEITLTSDQ